jgi:hypothetical protein
MKLQVPNSHANVNLAPQDGYDIASLKKLLVARPHLYAFDALLWQIGRERFIDYRSKVHEKLAPWSWPDNSRRAYVRGGDGIWLSENWYDPEMSGDMIAWWAGPKPCSIVRFKRSDQDQFLTFNVIVVNGIRHEDICIYAKKDFSKLNVERTARSPQCVTFCISLDGLEQEDQLLIGVPDAMAPIMTTETDTSITRLSFLATNWTLSQDSA